MDSGHVAPNDAAPETYSLPAATVVRLHALWAVAVAAQQEAQRAGSAYLEALTATCEALGVEGEPQRVTVDWVTGTLEAPVAVPNASRDFGSE